ncbi:MAG: hypothetical protein ACHQ52_15235 [Candidatus Eisenbacteria bacterium]
MRRLGWLTLGVSVLGTATAPRLTAQRVEIAARIGYAAPAGLQFQASSTTIGSSTEVRSWNGGGLSVGATGSYWLNARFGIQGTADLRFTRHHATFAYSCTTLCIPINLPPGPVDASATRLIASLRFSARQRVGDRLQLGAGVGPALIRFGDSEYRPLITPGLGYQVVYSLANRTTYGVAVGLSAAYVVAPRFRLSVSADEVFYRVWPAEASSWGEVVAPIQHEFTLSAAAVVGVR